jgi:hypothetical protein
MWMHEVPMRTGRFLKPLLRILAATVLLATTQAGDSNPDIAIYRGTDTLRTIISPYGGKVGSISRSTEIVNLATGESVKISFAKTGETKVFFTSPIEPHLLTTVPKFRSIGPKDYIVFASGIRDDTVGTDSVQARFLKGVKSDVNLRGDTITTAARILSGTRQGAVADSLLIETTVVLKLDLKASKAANDANETLDQVVARTEAELLASGYTSGNPE